VLYDGASDFGGVVLLGNDSTYSGSSAAYPAALGGWAGAGATAGKGGVASGIYGFTDNGAGHGVVGVNSGLVPGSGAGVVGTAAGVDNIAVEGINSVGTAIAGTSEPEPPTRPAARKATCMSTNLDGSGTAKSGASTSARGYKSHERELAVGTLSSIARELNAM
jgi:hypothetical protein